MLDSWPPIPWRQFGRFSADWQTRCSGSSSFEIRTSRLSVPIFSFLALNKVEPDGPPRSREKGRKNCPDQQPQERAGRGIIFNFTFFARGPARFFGRFMCAVSATDYRWPGDPHRSACSSVALDRYNKKSKKLNPTGRAGAELNAQSSRRVGWPGMCQATSRDGTVAIAASDRQLLERFINDCDSAAFRTLVVRHGPAVLQMCRSVLQDSHEAEDAFQATFIVLVRKARSLRDPEALGGWLRGVAHRTALRVRCLRGATSRGRAGPRRDVSIAGNRGGFFAGFATYDSRGAGSLARYVSRACNSLLSARADSSGGRPAARLAARHRQGATCSGARLLRERLDRRGVGLGAALLFFLLDPGKARAVPLPLVDSTARAMALVAAGRRSALVAEFGAAHALADVSTVALNGIPVQVAVRGNGRSGRHSGPFRSGRASISTSAVKWNRPCIASGQSDGRSESRLRLTSA